MKMVRSEAMFHATLSASRRFALETGPILRCSLIYWQLPYFDRPIKAHRRPLPLSIRGTHTTCTSPSYDPSQYSTERAMCIDAAYNTVFLTPVPYPDSPQQPSISHKTQDYPFMAGQPATLYCSLRPGTDRGNPPATLTWRGHTGSSGQGEVSLALTQLSSSDHGRVEVCDAKNSFTDHSNTPVSQQTVIDVYCEYHCCFV